MENKSFTHKLKKVKFQIVPSLRQWDFSGNGAGPGFSRIPRLPIRLPPRRRPDDLDLGWMEEQNYGSQQSKAIRGEA